MRLSRLVTLIVVFLAALIIIPNVIVTAQSFQLTIKIAKLNVRSGPSTRHAIVGQLVRDDVVTAIGRSKDRKWFVIEYPAAPGGQGWIINAKANYSSIGGNIVSLPEFATPPLPSKSKPTATPVVSAISPQPSGGGGSCPSVSARCSELSSCDQARACLAAGNTSLDRDHDGVPCESLCG